MAVLELLTLLHYVSQAAAAATLTLLAWHYLKPWLRQSPPEQAPLERQEHE